MRRATFAVDAAFLLAVAVVPLAWSKLFIAEFTLAKFVALNAALALAAWGAALRPESMAGGRTSADYPLLAGLAAAALSAAAAADPATSLRGRYDSYVFGLWGLALLAAVVQLAARSARGREAERARWLVWSAALVGGYGVSQKLGFDPLFHIADLPTGARAVSTLGSPVDLGAFLALAWPLSLWAADADRRARSLAAPLLIAGGLAASGSRGAVLAAGTGAAAYWLMTRRPKRGPALALAAAALTVAAAIAWTCRPGASVVDAARRGVWRTAWAIFIERPLLGAGLDGFEDAFRRLRGAEVAALMGTMHRQAYAHNDILQVLAGLGLLGAGVYAWLLAALGKAALRALGAGSSRPLAAALIAGLLALWVNLGLNPVAQEVLVVAAAAAGLLLSLHAAKPSGPLPRLGWACAGAAAAGSLFLAAGMARADAVFKRAAQAQAAGDYASARDLFASARAAAPCEMSYMLAEVNAIGDWINATHVVGERLSLLAMADADGRAALACHPRQVNAHYIAGTAARMHYDLGFKDQLAVSAREFDLALSLDPMFGALIDARREVSRLQEKP